MAPPARWNTSRMLGGAVVGAVLAFVAALLLGQPATHTTPQAQAQPAAPEKHSGDRPRKVSTVDWDTSKRMKPIAMSVPAIHARSSLVGLGLLPDHTLQTPPVSQPMQAGWYKLGPAPGQKGAAVITGHVDGYHMPGIFYHLDDVETGDTINVTRSDDSVVHFTVTRTREVAKSNFPTKQVYGPVNDPELRLVTCGGPFDRAVGSYEHNILVFADATSVSKPSNRN